MGNRAIITDEFRQNFSRNQIWQSMLMVGDIVWMQDTEGHYETRAVHSFNTYGEPLDDRGRFICDIDGSYRVLTKETEG